MYIKIGNYPTSLVAEVLEDGPRGVEVAMYETRVKYEGQGNATKFEVRRVNPPPPGKWREIRAGPKGAKAAMADVVGDDDEDDSFYLPSSFVPMLQTAFTEISHAGDD
jgi:hypothetical protein